MLFKANLENLYQTKRHWEYQNDILWKQLMPQSNWYMFNDYLGYQREGYSDLSQDYKIAIIPHTELDTNELENRALRAPMVPDWARLLSPSIHFEIEAEGPLTLNSQVSEKSSVGSTTREQRFLGGIATWETKVSQRTFSCKEGAGHKGSQDQTALPSGVSRPTVGENLGSLERTDNLQPAYTHDTIVNTVIDSFIKRSNFGYQKYGTTLDRDDLSVLDWIQHAQEEHMDAILYLEKLKTYYNK